MTDLKNRLLSYIEMERQSLKCLERDEEGYLKVPDVGGLVSTLLSNIETIIEKDATITVL